MYCDPQQFDGVPDQLFHNNHDGTFTDVSVKAGIANRAGKGLGVVVGDIDLDGWPDIFVTNDGVRNFLYRNKGDGTFQDITYTAGTGFDTNGKAMAGMGTEIADFDGDGLPDIFLTAFSREYNTLYRNRGKLHVRGRYPESRAAIGLSDAGVRNEAVRLRQRRRPRHLLHQRPRHRQRGTLRSSTQLTSRATCSTRTSAAAGSKTCRLRADRRSASSTSAAAPPLPISTMTATSISSSPTAGGPALLFRNDGGNRNHWLAIKARGRDSNRFGVGSKIRLTAGGVTQYREINPTGSYLSTSDMRLYIGLGKETVAQRLEIEWPRGKKQVARKCRRRSGSEFG